MEVALVEEGLGEPGAAGDREDEGEPEEKERKEDASGAVLEVGALAAVKEEEGGEESGDEEEDGHPEDVEINGEDGKGDMAGRVMNGPASAAGRTIGEGTVKDNAEEHHDAAEGVEGMESRGGRHGRYRRRSGCGT